MKITRFVNEKQIKMPFDEKTVIYNPAISKAIRSVNQRMKTK